MFTPESIVEAGARVLVTGDYLSLRRQVPIGGQLGMLARLLEKGRMLPIRIESARQWKEARETAHEIGCYFSIDDFAKVTKE